MGLVVVQDEARPDTIAAAVRERFAARGFFESIQQRVDQADSEAVRRRMEDVLHFFSDVSEAPILVVPCLYRISSPTSDPHSLLAGTSIYGAVQNLMFAARAEGLGTVLTTFNMRIEDVLRREFNLPDDAKPVAVIPVGWPDGERFGPTTRRPVQDVTYWDAWNATRSF